MAKKNQLGNIGRLGESLAIRWLIQHGHQIMGQNITYRFGELDVVTDKDKIIHCIEVKAASNDSRLQTRLAERLDDAKLKRLEKSALQFIQVNNLVDRNWQIDALLIYIDVLNKTARVKLLENININ